MGYTTGKTKLMIGLGVSSISDSWYSFAQNEKSIDDYYARLEANELPIFKGHLLSNEDLVVRQHILNIMCNLETSWKNPEMQLQALPEILSHLNEMEDDGILVIFDDHLIVKEEGRMFIRNICMAFDLKLHESKPETKLFSMTI